MYLMDDAPGVRTAQVERAEEVGNRKCQNNPFNGPRETILHIQAPLAGRAATISRASKRKEVAVYP